MVTLVFNELKVGFRTLERISIISILQRGFFWQKIWRTFIHIFEVRWKWPFSKLFFSITSLWNQIISCKILIITVISNEIANGLAIYAKLCRSGTIFFRQEIASLFQVQGKLRACRNSEWSFSSSCFNKGNSHLKLISSYTVAFNENAISCFLENVHLLIFFSNKSTSKLLWFIQLHKSNAGAQLGGGGGGPPCLFLKMEKSALILGKERPW